MIICKACILKIFKIFKIFKLTHYLNFMQLDKGLEIGNYMPIQRCPVRILHDNFTVYMSSRDLFSSRPWRDEKRSLLDIGSILDAKF